MKIAVLGSGGREHAIAWKLSQENSVKEVFQIPGQQGFVNSIPLDIYDFSAVKEFCLNNFIDLVIVGPENLLAKGIVESFEGTGIFVFGPGKEASKLESSKIWAKNFMKKYGVETADFLSFKHFLEAENFILERDGNVVIKYDGLAEGKGVSVCSCLEEAILSVKHLHEIHGQEASFLVEEKLVGEELSLLAFTDGKECKFLIPSQDYKRAFDQNRGPNTGGMGAYCPLPFWNEQIEEEIREKIVDPTLRGLYEESLYYCGVIYFGIILTKQGPKLLEYNVRFGDPETEVVLAALKSDLLPLIMACFQGKLKEVEMSFYPGTFIDVVLASKGYPKAYKTGYEITGLEKLSEDTLVFYGGVEKGKKTLRTKGGRVLHIVVQGENLEDASEKVYQECRKIHFNGMFYRKDISKRLLVTC